MSLKDTDVRTLGDAAIAKKFKLSLAKVRSLVNQGAKHEKEHNTNLAKAKEVARDHIGERPDYYKMLKKAEKTPVSMKEENATGAVRGLGFVTGDPGVSAVDQYINTNAMSYIDWNGNILKMIQDKHNKHLKDMGFSSFSPNDLQNNTNKVVKEAKLNELGEYDNKGGTVGAEGLTDPAPIVQKRRSVKEQSPANISYKERPMYERSTKLPADMTDAAERGIYEVSDTLVGKVSNAAFWKNRPLKPSTQRRIKAAQLRDPEEIKRENKKRKSVEEDANRPDRDLEARTYTGATGTTKTIHEETKMDNKEYINEALDCILEDNLTEMKDNLMLALQEKAMTKLEERKKEIAANYFAE